MRRSLLFALSLFPVAALAGAGGPADGRVINFETGQPIAGAIVVAKWKASDLENAFCVHVEAVITDADGKYHFDAWARPWRGLWAYVVSKERLDLYAYKAGYTRAPGSLSERTWQEHFKERRLIPFRGTGAERMKDLNTVSASTSCNDAGESRKNLYRLDWALSEEARAIATTATERQSVERFFDRAEDDRVNHTKPVISNEHGRLRNTDPRDSYKKEDLLK